jgi:hypothetical protein
MGYAPLFFSGIVGRRHSVSVFVPFSPTHFARAQSILSTTNGSAKTSGANKTVNGYLIFILYSVFILARASPPFPLSKIADT